MAILYDLGRRNRYDVTYDVIYANEACNATNSRHLAGTGSSPVRIVLITKMGPPVSPQLSFVAFVLYNNKYFVQILHYCLQFVMAEHIEKRYFSV